MKIKWECPGCDERRGVPSDEPVVVKSPAAVALVLTCPECGCVHVDDEREVVWMAEPFVRSVTLVDRDPAAGAQRDGAISEAEVLLFTKKLERSPDGRSADPWHAGRYVMLSALWAELAGARS